MAEGLCYDETDVNVFGVGKERVGELVYNGRLPTFIRDKSHLAKNVFRNIKSLLASIFPKKSNTVGNISERDIQQIVTTVQFADHRYGKKTIDEHLLALKNYERHWTSYLPQDHDHCDAKYCSAKTDPNYVPIFDDRLMSPRIVEAAKDILFDKYVCSIDRLEKIHSSGSTSVCITYR